MSRVDQAFVPVWSRARLPVEQRSRLNENHSGVRATDGALSGLKVCFVAGTLGPGGAERQLYYILRALRNAGADARVLCLDRNGFWESEILKIGVPVVWVGGSGLKLGRLLRIISELRKHRPQVVQSQHFFTNSYAALSSWALRLGSIGALRSNGVMETLDCGRFGGWLNLQTPNLLAANSRAALQYALEQGQSESKLFHLPSVVDTNQWTPASPHPPRPLRLLAVGRLVRAKRFDRFLSVLAGLRHDYHQEVKGVIVGDGPLQGELETQAQRFGLQSSVIEFRGRVDDPAPVYREMDALVVTSDFEGTPNVILEAMASGLPVIATRVGGVPEVVHHGKNGLIVDADDVDGMIDGVNKLIANPHLRARLGKAARAYVECHHSLDCLPGRLVELYNKALHGKFVGLESSEQQSIHATPSAAHSTSVLNG
jgi:glycosyltransferase involved in cell wall biosynthesis